MRILVISTSLRPTSRSRLLARSCFESVQASSAEGVEVEWLDLQDIDDIPFCDADRCWSHPTTARLKETIARADGIIVATPIYNYTVSSSFKNLIELTGRQWQGKVVGFLCAAGGTGSYMAIMGMTGSLMLDFRCIVVPRFVYATGDSFEGAEITDEAVAERIDELAQTVGKLTAAMQQ